MNLFDLPEIIHFEERNAFQSKVPAQAIKDIELKFLDPRLRLYTEHSGKALTAEEREIYARYLESKGQPLGAASFRNYVEPKAEVKKEKNVRKKK